MKTGQAVYILDKTGLPSPEYGVCFVELFSRNTGEVYINYFNYERKQHCGESIPISRVVLVSEFNKYLENNGLAYTANFNCPPFVNYGDTFYLIDKYFYSADMDLALDFDVFNPYFSKKTKS